MLQEVDHQEETNSDSELPDDEDEYAIKIIMGSQFNPAAYKPGSKPASTEEGALHEKSQRLVKCSCCAEAIVIEEKATIQCFKCHDKTEKKPRKTAKKNSKNKSSETEGNIASTSTNPSEKQCLLGKLWKEHVPLQSVMDKAIKSIYGDKYNKKNGEQQA